MNANMKDTTEAEDLSLDGTESRSRLEYEWHPGGITEEHEVREVVVWRGERFQDAEIHTAVLA